MKQSSKKLHILVKYFYPVAAGTETNILETYSVLMQKGWDVTVYTSKDTLTQKNILKNEEIIRGIKVKRGSFSKLSNLTSIALDESSIVCLHHFNILPFIPILFYSYLLKIINKKTYSLMLTPHGGFTPEWSIYPRVKSQIQKFVYYSIGVSLINRVVDGIRAVSEWEKEALIKKNINPQLITTITNGIEKEALLPIDQMATKEIKEKVKQFGKYMIQIGRIEQVKNYETVIRSMQKVPSNINFVIVGPVEDKVYEKKLINLIEQLGMNKRVIFTGVIRGIDKYYLIKHAEMMVHMAFNESFCNSVHEGLSQGLICIVANNSALPYLIKDNINGYCLPTTDDKQLAQKINYVLEQKEENTIKIMQKRNEETAKSHSWANTAEKMNILYNSLLKKEKI